MPEHSKCADCGVDIEPPHYWFCEPCFQAGLSTDTDWRFSED